MIEQTQVQDEDYTMMNVKRYQLRRIKVAAAMRGKAMVDLLDEMIDYIEGQNGQKPCEDKPK